MLASGLKRLYQAVFQGIEFFAGNWFLGAFVRFCFAAVLLVYFWNSALTKISAGALGFLQPSVGAYAQILPSLTETAGYDVSQIAFFPYGLIVLMGTWAEFVLPALIVAGLFTRAASLGFIGFVAVMTYVDVTGHGVDAGAVGAWFDGNPASLIADQRLLWMVMLVYLVLKGPGQLSLDYLLGRMSR
ncbi:DoxX family protein [Polycladidibacter hongkongensis]|uniref:DoxX family protein n=1 Tax=Polycladidibacter hongkongensis TaxID=1647556 RepID=UPI0008369EF7|nr:DoxX family protein [Pseudovibrio hongkongensis]